MESGSKLSQKTNVRHSRKRKQTQVSAWMASQLSYNYQAGTGGWWHHISDCLEPGSFCDHLCSLSRNSNVPQQAEVPNLILLTLIKTKFDQDPEEKSKWGWAKWRWPTSIDFGIPSLEVWILLSEWPNNFPVGASFLAFLTICSASVSLLLLLPWETRRNTFWSRIDDVTFFKVYFWVGVDKLVDDGPVFLKDKVKMFKIHALYLASLHLSDFHKLGFWVESNSRYNWSICLGHHSQLSIATCQECQQCEYQPETNC